MFKQKHGPVSCFCFIVYTRIHMELFSPERPTLDKPSVINTLSKNIQNQLEIFAKNDETSLFEFLDNNLTPGYEDILEEVLHSLPSELISKRIALYEQEGKTLFEALKDSLELMEKRNSMWHYDGKEEYSKETIETIKVFDGAKYQLELFEGRGNAAFVFQVPEVPGVCIKFLHSPDMQRYSPEREFGILSTVSELSQDFKALKIPQPHGIAIHTEATKSFFTMETIDGMTLLELTERPGERQKFFERSNLSESYIISLLSDTVLQEKMTHDLGILHKNGILHGDIHPRNIMMNTKGDFYLIDFGNAIIETNLPVGVNSETIENTKETDMKAFTNCFTLTAKVLKEQGNTEKE
jgi:tRNA A-37 threonylcarbamoyl transferase component Bud32